MGRGRGGGEGGFCLCNFFADFLNERTVMLLVLMLENIRLLFKITKIFYCNIKAYVF